MSVVQDATVEWHIVDSLYNFTMEIEKSRPATQCNKLLFKI